MKNFAIEHSILFIPIDQMPEELLGDIDAPYNFILGSTTTTFRQSRLPLEALGLRFENKFDCVVTINDVETMDIDKALQEDIERLKNQAALPPKDLAEQIRYRQTIAEIARERDDPAPADDIVAVMPDFVKNSRDTYAPPTHAHYKRRRTPTSPLTFDTLN